MLERLLALGSLPLLIGALLAAGLGVPIPEDPVLLAAGVIAHRTAIPWWLVLASVYGAVLSADCLLFLIGRHVGDRLMEHRAFRRFATSRRRKRVAELLAKHGSRAVFIGRHMSGLRPVVFVMAGVEGMRLRRFLFWDALAALISVPAMFALGYLFSSHVAAVASGFARARHWITASLGMCALLAWLLWPQWKRRRRDS